jgi:hypothetical protein
LDGSPVSAQSIDMRDFLEAVIQRIPDGLHPMARQLIHEDYSCARESEDPATVWRHIQRIQDRVAQELCWQAEDEEFLASRRHR